MKGLCIGLTVGIVLGSALGAATQWAYVGVYKAADLVRAPAYILAYSAGVYDSLAAQQYHTRGGGLGQEHLDRAWYCLRSRIYGAAFTKWALGVLASEPNRYAAMLLLDRVCVGLP